MSLKDLIPDEHQTDWESIRCPNCQTHEELTLTNRNTKLIVCENDGCRVSTFQISEENR